MTKQWSLDKVCDAHGYSDVRKMSSVYNAHKHFITWLHERYPEKPFSVLDVGCGSGRLLNFLPDNLVSYIGVDINNKSLKAGKEYFSENPWGGVKVKFHLFDIEDDKIDIILNEKVDVIFFDSTFTMLRAPFRCLDKLFEFCDNVYFARTSYTNPTTTVSLQQWRGMDKWSEHWKFSKEDLEKFMPIDWNFKSISTDDFVMEKTPRSK